MKSISKSEAIQYGWKTTKAHLGLFLGLMVLLGLLQLVTDITNGQAHQRKVFKEDFSAVTGNVDLLYADLVQNGYITPDGVIRDKFTDMNDVRKMVLAAEFEDKKIEIIQVFLKALRSIPPSRYKFYGIALVLWIIKLIAQIGLLKIFLKVYDNGPASAREIFSYAHLAVKYLLASLLYSLVVLAGLLLLVVPGVIWGMKYQMFALLIVDKNLGIKEAFQKSAELTSGVKLSLFVFMFILGLLNLAGILLLFVGLLITVPLTLMAYIHVYRSLLSQLEPVPA
ncbi:MAG: hypothetical protein WC450_07185 [Candidatus Omnitrophota bacterium]|jgi:hypothetical protein